ncbi:MAG TPA: hypothetical protein VEZ44_07190 [bacterium]|nr:hypothetical protein [bacterium]
MERRSKSTMRARPGRSAGGHPRRGPADAAARARAGRTRLLVAVVAGVVLVAAGVLLAQRITQVQQGAVTPDVPQGATLDPALRARGAAISISGDASHPQASYDPASGTVLVRLQSKYYDPKHTAALNRQYLATEGRLVVQLALYNAPEAGRVVAELYHGRQKVATVTGASGDAYNDYRVDYAKGLP